MNASKTQTTRRTKNRRDTLLGHMRHSNILGSRFKDLEDAERIASILNPIGQAHKLGSNITGAQCQISHSFVRTTENTNTYDDDHDPFEGQEMVFITLHLKSPASLTRFNQIRPSLENALMAHGYGLYQLKAICDPSAYAPLDKYDSDRCIVERFPSEKASQEAEKLANELSDNPELAEAFRTLSKTLKPKSL